MTRERLLRQTNRVLIIATILKNVLKIQSYCLHKYLKQTKQCRHHAEAFEKTQTHQLGH